MYADACYTFVVVVLTLGSMVVVVAERSGKMMDTTMEIKHDLV